MKIETKLFGEIDVQEDKIITFSDPILGFEDYTQFTVIDSLDDELFYWLQSIEEPALSFMMINPLNFVKDYQITLTDKFQEKLDIDQDTKNEDIVFYTFVAAEDETKLRTNLKAPIIINTESRKGGQLVLQKDYPTRYYLFNEEETAARVIGG
ncbi:flagellar assembly protein FliW [Natroniella acetigena]|uniref:flagellar assembly protein FliW n=1 Tax=Natroniella acetigena TaxID=52004 RepID=UPI00200AF4B7|nr:flagellar assembly protein FliW [Natroniella acetigena]MCK8827022.1 flagellar assembly protein FliW [Natroniella acetigena]